jgi:hypothetical protein
MNRRVVSAPIIGEDGVTKSDISRRGKKTRILDLDLDDTLEFEMSITRDIDEYRVETIEGYTLKKTDFSNYRQAISQV